MIDFLNKRLKPKDWRGEPVIWKQYKKDGHRLTLIKDDSGSLKAYGRKPIDLSEKLKHYEWWQRFNEIPKGTVIDGEVCVDSGSSNDVSTHLAKGTDGRLEFYPFAVPIWYNQDFSKAHLDVIDEILTQCIGFRLTSYFKINQELDTRERLLYDAGELDIEGWVLKQRNYEGWWRLKPVKTLDCIVTGFQDGEGKYLGGVGALLVSVYRSDNTLIEIAKVSGMTDSVRWNIDEKLDLGRVCEIKYQQVGARGRLRFPRFVRWRDDKPAKECTL